MGKARGEVNSDAESCCHYTCCTYLTLPGDDNQAYTLVLSSFLSAMVYILDETSNQP